MFGSCSCQAAGIWRGDLHFGVLFTAKPKHSQLLGLEFGAKGNCSCCEALQLPWTLPRNSGKLQVLGKIKIGKTTDLRMVTPCSPCQQLLGHFITSLGRVTAEQQCRMWLAARVAQSLARLALSLSPQPGSVPAFHQPCSSPKLGRMGGDSRCRDSSVCLCCARGAPEVSHFPLSADSFLHSWLSLLRFPPLQRGHTDTSSKL